MKRLLAIDPGKTSGFALFEDGQLVCAWEEKHKSFKTNSVALEFIKRQKKYPTIFSLIIEYPQIYPIKSWIGDPNDLILVGTYVGFFIGVFITYWILFLDQINTPKARDWKGQTPKQIMNERTLEKLSHVESACIKKKSTHVLDAIGLGLWKLGR